jgi:hypothetical protein
MAVGSPSPQALPFVCYVEQQQGRRDSASQFRRNVVAAGLLAVALCGAVLVVLTPSAPLVNAEKAALSKAMPTKTMLKITNLAPKDSHLALMIIRAAQTQSLENLHKIVKNWQDRMVSSDDDDSSHGAMLAAVPRTITQALEETNRVCAKKDIIFDKLDKLLAKLGAESFNRNQTDSAAQANADATMKAWLDAESEYRLQEEKVKEAEEGAKFARDRFEKYSEIVKQTSERYDSMKSSYGKELSDIADEKALLTEILRMFGILGDQPLTDVAKNAGGYMSGAATKDAMPQQLDLAMVKAKIAQLKEDAQNGGPISLQQISLLQTKLANFQESDQVKDMLTSMLKDLEDRASTMNDSLDRTATELAGHKKKLYDYEVSVVDLSNAADKARMKKSSMNLQREKLAGDKTNAGETYKTEHAEYVVVEPPAGKNAVCHFSSSCVIYH